MNHLLKAQDGISIAGITRIRNESDIIVSTLDYFSDFCNAGIFVYDDASTDGTPDLCDAHPAVKGVIRNTTWDKSRSGRQLAEGQYRMEALGLARKTSNPDWIYCFDADERPEIDLAGADLKSITGIRLRLFDFYITPEDACLSWEHRTWMGPEYRDILMMFRSKNIKVFLDREPALENSTGILFIGFVRHYGKAKSVQEWETTCHYYGNHLPEPYSSKWRNRIGKAIKHDMKSDFGSPLIKWDDRFDKGFPLTGEIEARERRHP